MKKAIWIIVFAIFLILSINTVQAAGNDWISGNYCNKSDDLLTFKQAEYMITVPYKDDQEGGKFLTDPKLDSYCINTKYVSSLVDYQYATGDKYGYCPIDTATNITYKAAIKGGQKEVIYSEWGGLVSCCPIDQPFAFRSGGQIQFDYCCTADVEPVYDRTLNAMICSDGRKASTFITSSNAQLGSNEANPKGSQLGPVFPDAQKVYSCPEPSCFTDLNGNVPDANIKRLNLKPDEISDYYCYEQMALYDSSGEMINLDANPGPIPGGKYCYNGLVLTKDEIKEWGSLLGLYGTCLDLAHESDVNYCISCYKKCQGYATCPLIYNSLGCIDTNPQGLVTRVFQIGIGIMGAVGIIRIMQAAFMRQSGDPAKIKESYDIINSVLIGALVLILGIVVLRFIGINVLQLLPFDFLQ